MDRQFKRSKKGVVELTSLLDLLFVMIFVSLLQQKEVTPPPAPTPAPVKVPAPAPKVAAKPKPKVIKKEQPKKEPKKVLYSVSAVFNFYSVSGQKFNGKYLMEGIFNNDTGRLNLGSVKWIDKPPFDIVMVPLSGKVTDDQSSFTGRVEAKGCEEFNLKRTGFKKNSPISGVWKGTYTCAQGSTGLTLTID